MSYFDDASLVMIPSGYKDQKVYSVKPIDGSGDLTFSRASDATRVNSSGLVEKVRTNFVLQSNTFNNASWSNGGSGVVLTSGQEDPFGGTNGWRFLIASASGYLSQNSVLQTNVSMTVSVWVKSNTGVGQSFRMTANSGAQTSPFLSATTSWTRVSWSFVSSSNGNILFPFSSTSALDLLFYGFQVETGDIATDYIATTSAAVSVGATANTPRLDYSGGASCPSLLLEPQRTNLYTFSEQTDNAAWGKTNASVTANNTASPDGYTNADKVVANTTNGVHRIEQDKATATQVATQSVFAKASGYNFIALENGGEIAYFNISTGVVGTVSGGTASIQDYGNGWYRCNFTATALNTKSYIYISNADNVISFAGDNISGAFIYGAQFEAGAYATSYIPTLSSAVTRVADAASKTGIASLIGQSEGTIFLDFVAQQTSTPQSHIWLDTDIAIFGGTTLTFYTSGGAEFNGGTLVTGQRYKVAFGYKLNDFVAYVNGVQVGTDTSGTVPATSNLYLNQYSTGIQIHKKELSQALLFKTRLTNAQLAELTA